MTEVKQDSPQSTVNTDEAHKKIGTRVESENRGRKLTPRDLCEGVAKGPKFKEMSSNCRYERGNEVCVTGKQNGAPAGGTHTFSFISICVQKTHRSDSGASFLILEDLMNWGTDRITLTHPGCCLHQWWSLLQYSGKKQWQTTVLLPGTGSKHHKRNSEETQMSQS